MDVENYGDMVKREQEQAERILHEFLTAAAEIKKICMAHDQCSPKCPLYDKEKDFCRNTYLLVDTQGMDPWEWEI